jgi:3-hydroxyisobutyrate dehydrogenase-like beta-hydroxyacid dehydrogenase
MSTGTPVSVLGLGAMGRALATAFARAGHPTTVWNRTPRDVDGVRRAPTAADAIAASALVVVCLVDEDAVTAVLAGHDLAGRTVVDVTNSTPAQARKRAAALAEQGAAHLDGGIMAVPPMIGSEAARVLYSGPPEVFAAAAPTLAALGEARHVGDDPGAAALHDIALLSAMYGMFGGALHAYALLRRSGRDAAGLAPLLHDWLGAMLPSVTALGAEIDHGNPEPAASPLAMQAAGFVNLRDAARDVGLDDRLLAPMGRLLDEAVAAGHGDRDVDALAELLT